MKLQPNGAREAAARRERSPRLVLALGIAGFAATAVVVACAESDDLPHALVPEPEEPIAVPEAAPPVVDASVDGDAGCESLDPSLCTPSETRCDEVDWCPAKDPVDSRRAFTSVWGASQDDVWAVGSSGAVIHFDGTEWKDASLDTTRTLFSVHGSGPNDVWIVGTYGTIFHGPGFDAGAPDWQPAPIVPYNGASEKTLSSVWSPSPDEVWITGESLRIPGQSKAGTQYRGDLADGGMAWTLVSPCATCSFMSSVWGTSARELWAVGQGGKAFHTTEPPPADGGDGDPGAAAPVWVAVDTRTQQDLRAVWGIGKDDVWVVGRRGTIRRYRSGAAQAEIVAPPGTTQDLHAVWGSASDDVWAVGDYGTILHFDGAAWHASTAAFPIGVKPHLYGVWGSSATDVWVVGEGIVLHFTGAKK